MCRCQNIFRCLRFYDETPDKTNHLHKIDQVLNHVTINVENIYCPGENLPLDEGLLLRRSRLLFSQYIPLKKLNLE